MHFYTVVRQCIVVYAAPWVVVVSMIVVVLAVLLQLAAAQTPAEAFESTRLLILLSALVFGIGVALTVTAVQVWRARTAS